MGLRKMPNKLLLFAAGLLSLVVGVNTLGQPEGKEMARQMAAAADDNAASLEARQEALSKLNEAVRLFLGAGETVEAAGVLNRVGRLQLKLSSPQAALDSHNQALSLLKRTPNVDLEVDGLNGLGAAYLLLQEKTRAAEVLDQSVSLSKQSGYTRGWAEALLTRGDLQNYDNHALGLQTAQESLALWETLGDKGGLARAYSLVGRCYMAQNTLSDATQNYEEALQLWRELNNPSEQAEALIMLGFIEHRKGEWQSAIAYFEQARGLLDEKAEPYRMGQIAAGLGAAFIENGLPEISITYYQRALDYYRQRQDPHLIMIANWRLGQTYYLLGNYTEALTRFQQALAGLAQDGLDAATNYEYIGRVYGAMREYAKALTYLQSALVIYTRAVNPKEAAEVLGLMGQIYEQQGQLQSAEQYYRRSLQTFVKLSDRLNQAAVYYALGRLELRRGNNEVAEAYLHQSIEITENIRRVPVSSDLTAAFSATVHERYESYIECLMRKHRKDPTQGFDVRAFNTSELARGRALAELLRATQTNLAPGLDPQLAQQEKSLRQSLRVKEDYRVTVLSKEYKQEELAALDAEIARLETEYKQVNETIRVQYPAYEQMNRPTAWDLRQIQERVIADDQTVLLEYSLGAEKSYVWAVTHTKVTSYELPGQTQITEAAQRVYQLLKDKPGTDKTNGLTNAVQYLGGMVLSPVAAELNKRRIIVVADGALNYIPFQILPSPSADNEPLVTSYEVVNAPSASILGQLQQEAARRQTPAKVLAAFGDPVFASNYAQRKETDDGNQDGPAQTNEDEQWRHAVRDIQPSGDSFDPAALEPLFFTKRELANLREVAGAETFVATGFDATREKLESADLTKYAILHFATHGILDPKRPENSGIFLSMVNRDGKPQNGFVGLQDIYNLRAPVDLVVLSACRTGLGKDVRGEGLIGLTRGFMYAGASSVVASLWKVDDEATSELMKRFYSNMLQRGMTPAAALRAAQNSIRQEPHWSSPYYWAAFTLQGDYHHAIKATTTTAESTRLLIIIGVVLLILLPWLYRSHRRMRTA
jgi:CHAT domain-containing protein/TolA-binding protein